MSNLALAGALGALVVLAVLDQTSGKLSPNYAANAAVWRGDQAFVDQIERTLPPGSAVFQVPYLPFPESRGVLGLGDSGHFRGYVHSDHLKWSYAAMRGREADWQATLADRPMAELAPAIAAAGFDGLWLDPAGYAHEAERVTAELAETLGYGPTVQRAGGRGFFWDLRPYLAGLRTRQPGAGLSSLARDTLHPVRWSYPDDGFHAREASPEGSLRWSSAPVTELTLDNPYERSRDTRLLMRLARPGAAPGVVVVTFPDGRQKVVTATPEGTWVRETLSIPPGESTIRIRVSAQPIVEADAGRSLYVQVRQLQIADRATLGIR